jgi:hypothetical protein
MRQMGRVDLGIAPGRAVCASTFGRLIVVASAIFIPSCSSPTSTRPTQEPSGPIAADTAASAAAAPSARPASAPPGASAAEDAGGRPSVERKPAVRRTAVPDPNTFACGGQTCRVGQETCCAYGDEGHCLPSRTDEGPKGAIGYLRPQWEACEKETFAQATRFDRIARCDESADCPAQHVCCLDFLYSGGEGVADCVPLRRDGRTPCDYGEQCIAGSPCRLPGTTCEEGHCVRPVPNFPCGSAPCGRGEVCCGGLRGCVPADGCPYAERMQCRRAEDCIPGQQCILSSDGNTVCTAGYPEGGVGVPAVCRSDRDCKSSCEVIGGGPEQCVQSDIPWIKHCKCPGP